MTKQKQIKQRVSRVRRKLKKVSSRLRLSVFRSNKHIWAQIIDDSKQHTLVSASSKEVKEKGTKTEIAKKVGELIAKKAKSKKITKIYFDRGGYKYHGRVKALAESAREKGLEF